MDAFVSNASHEDGKSPKVGAEGAPAPTFYSAAFHQIRIKQVRPILSLRSHGARQRGLEPATGEATSKSFLGDAYQLAKDAANTVTLTGKTFASSAELKDFFDDAHVENYIGEFNVSQDENHSLTAVETYDKTYDPLLDTNRDSEEEFGLDWAATNIQYTAFTTDVAHDALVLTKGEVKDVTGYASVDFNGETAGEKVSNVELIAAKIDGEGNHVTADDIAGMAMDDFTGKVTNTSTTGQPIITAAGATAEFTDYANVTKLTAGSVVGSFASVDFDGAASGGDPETNKVTGSITKADFVTMLKNTHVEYIESSTDVQVAVDCISDWAGSDNLKTALENRGIYCSGITFTHAS